MGRLAAALVIGVAVGAAPAQVQEARQRDSLLATAQAEERLMALRFTIVRQEYEAAVKRAEVGVASRASLAAAEAQLREAELQLHGSRLDIEEIKSTSAAARDDIGAPAVNGRDFVKERLQLEAATAQRNMTSAEAALQETRRRLSIGAESQLAVQQAEVELERARVRLAFLAEKLDLRKRFLASHLSTIAVERELRTLELRNALMLAKRQTMVAAARLEVVRGMVDAGTAPRAELLRAELEVLERKAEIEQIENQIRALRSGEGAN